MTYSQNYIGSYSNSNTEGLGMESHSGQLSTMTDEMNPKSTQEITLTVDRGEGEPGTSADAEYPNKPTEGNKPTVSTQHLPFSSPSCDLSRSFGVKKSKRNPPPSGPPPSLD